MTFEELQVAIVNRSDVEEAAVAGLLAGADPRVRVAAATAVARTAARRALASYARVAAEQNYSDQATIDTIVALAPLSDVQEPYIDVVKALGLRAARAGRFEQAMSLLQMAVSAGATAGQSRDRRSREAMRFTNDLEIDRAIEGLAAHFVAPPARGSIADPLRVAILCSGIQDEDGPTVITVKRA
jgi:hypothetical protein